MLEWHVGALTDERVPKFFAVVDSLHLTHCHRPGVVEWRDVADSDRRLAALGARLLFVHATRDTIWQRCIQRRRNSDFVTGYAARNWGPSLKAIQSHFVDEQTATQAHLADTRLAHRSLAIDAPLAT